MKMNWYIPERVISFNRPDPQTMYHEMFLRRGGEGWGIGFNGARVNSWGDKTVDDLSDMTMTYRGQPAWSLYQEELHTLGGNEVVMQWTLLVVRDGTKWVLDTDMAVEIWNRMVEIFQLKPKEAGCGQTEDL